MRHGMHIIGHPFDVTRVRKDAPLSASFDSVCWVWNLVG